MSEIELGPVSERLDEEEIKTLGRLLDQAGAKYPLNDEKETSQIIASRLSEDAMTEFMDRLEAHDIAADFYLPIEFEGRLAVGDFRVASGQTLVDILEEMKEELAVEEDDEYEDDEEEEEDDETAEALEELENQELQLLDEEANEAMLVDELAELRAMRREELTLDVDAQSQKADEFVCQSCFMVKRTSQLANKRKMICFDCVD
jgi:hypothetical protein